jgi:hypothetical protein
LASAVPYPKCEKKGTMLMRSFPKLAYRISLLGRNKHATHSKKNQGGNMKKLFALTVLSLCMAAPSFGADVVGHSAKVAGEESYKAAKVSAKETGKAGKAVVKFLF